MSLACSKSRAHSRGRTAREDRGNGATRATISRQPYRSRIWSKKIVILTDDGLATGATMRAAVMSLRQRKIARCSRPTCANRISGPSRPTSRASPRSSLHPHLQSAGWHHPLKYLKKFAPICTRILARRCKRAAGRPDHGAVGLGEVGDGLKNGANKSIGIGKNVVVLCSLEISFIVCR